MNIPSKALEEENKLEQKQIINESRTNYRYDIETAEKNTYTHIYISIYIFFYCIYVFHIHL